MEEEERQIIYREIREWFISFTAQYDNAHPTLGTHFQQKKVHTEHVCELMKELTRREGFSAEDAWIALISARLHDVARFEQILHFETYNDAHSFDHGNRAVEIVQEQKVLARLSPDARHLVCTAVQHHHRKDTAIPPTLSQRELLFLSILRDADKLDNIRKEVEVRAPVYKAEIDVLVKQHTLVSEKVLSTFLRSECIDYQDVQTTIDRVLLVTSWAFDLNTQTAVEMCKAHDWFNQLLDVLPQDQSYIKQARLLVAKHLDERLALHE